MDKYDLCIIGAGPSGYAAAMRAVDFGKRVVSNRKGQSGWCWFVQWCTII